MLQPTAVGPSTKRAANTTEAASSRSLVIQVNSVTLQLQGHLAFQTQLKQRAQSNLAVPHPFNSNAVFELLRLCNCMQSQHGTHFTNLLLCGEIKQVLHSGEWLVTYIENVLPAKGDCGVLKQLKVYTGSAVMKVFVA